MAAAAGARRPGFQHRRDFSLSVSLVRRNYTDVLRLWNPNSDKFGRVVLEWAY